MSLSGRFRTILDSLPVAAVGHAAADTAEIDQGNRFVVAYSGGVDSHVLLHLCKRVGVSVRAIHINHGLQQQADAWSLHCEQVCRELDIPFQAIWVDARPAAGDSPENAARQARYAALYQALEKDEILLTAHHANDQAETLLLQLFRGAGPAGLAAMPRLRTVSGTRHARPLLAFSRREIHQYAEKKQLHWVDDPSNVNTDINRNYVRHHVLPVIRQRWPQADTSLVDVSLQQQHALDVMNDMADLDLATVITPHTHVLSVDELGRLSRARQFNVLRRWLNRYANDRVTANALQEIVNSVLPASEDAAPVVRWGDSEVRRYQEGLYLLDSHEHDATQSCHWNPRQTPVLEILELKLCVGPANGSGLKMELMDRDYTVAFRTGGESMRPAGRGHTHQLKKLMQEAGIPPWMRSRIPLLYLDDELVCVCGYWLAEGYVVEHGQEGWLPVCGVI